jgi:hypothetical protein
LKPEGKRPLATLTSGKEDNIKKYLKEIGRKGDDWANLVQDRQTWWAPMKNMRTTLPK